MSTHKQQNLTTPRLLLRALQSDDRDFVSSLWGDEKVRQYLGGAIPLHRRHDAFAALLSEGDGAMVWLVTRQATQEKLGLVYLSKHREEAFFELSYEFATAAWGHGDATQACQRVLDFALQDLRWERVVAETQASNLASRRLLARLNMQELRRLQRFQAEQIVFITP